MRRLAVLGLLGFAGIYGFWDPKFFWFFFLFFFFFLLNLPVKTGGPRG